MFYCVCEVTSGGIYWNSEVCICYCWKIQNLQKYLKTFFYIAIWYPLLLWPVILHDTLLYIRCLIKFFHWKWKQETCKFWGIFGVVLFIFGLCCLPGVFFKQMWFLLLVVFSQIKYVVLMLQGFMLLADYIFFPFFQSVFPWSLVRSKK